MSTAVKIRASWLDQVPRRLDASYYGGPGQREAKAFIAAKIEKKALLELTEEGKAGIFLAGRFKRRYVENPDYGYPFITGSGVIQSDPLATCNYVSRKYTPQVETLRLIKGMSVLTRSGSIGNIAYITDYLSGALGSDDLIRIVPDKGKIPPGYLYAFLSSSIGQALINQSTYGSVVQHIEAHHLYELPIPILDYEVIEEIDHLIKKCWEIRSETNLKLRDLKHELEGIINVNSWKYDKEHVFATDRVNSNRLKKEPYRLDAFHHVGYCGEAIDQKIQLIPLSSVAQCHRPNILKRMKVTQNGIPFLGGIELHTISQVAKEQISKKTNNYNQYIIPDSTVLFQCVGQRYGIFGRPVLANDSVIGKGCSEHLMRLYTDKSEDAGYLSIFYSTEIGERLLMQFSAGTSIPVLQESGAKKSLVYWPDESIRISIGKRAIRAWNHRHFANVKEREAISKLEQELSKWLD